MAAKIKLDLDPQEPLTFEHAVKIPTPDGKPLVVTFTFKHRTRAEMAAWSEQNFASRRQEILDSIERQKQEEAAIAAAAERGERYIPETPNLVELVGSVVEKDIDGLMDIAVNWNLEHEFSRENIGKFLALYPKAAYAAGSDYAVSLNEGRLGN